MAIDQEILKATGLYQEYSFWNGLYWKFYIAAGLISVFAAIAVCVGGFAQWKTSTITDKAATAFAAKNAENAQREGRLNPLWLKSEKQLEDDRFELVAVRSGKDGDSELRIFRRANELDSSIPASEDIVFRRNNETLAVATIIAVAGEAIWEYASAESLIVDGETVSIYEAIARSRLDVAMSDARGKKIEIVGIGLDSYPRASPNPFFPLSAERSRNLYGVLTAPEFEWSDDPNIEITAVDLGRALTPAERGSPEEVRQRAAIVMAVSRRQMVDDWISFAEVLIEVVRTSEINGTDLKLYEHSNAPVDRLLSKIWSGVDPIPAEFEKPP